ncbi:nitrilase-related carbon-nitrogen hydrolase [Brevundimonas sp. 2YAF1]
MPLSFTGRISWLAGLGLASVAGGLLAAGYALHPLWWAPWLAPIPLLIAAAQSARASRIVGALAGAIAVTSVLSYYVEQTGWVGAAAIAGLRIGAWMLATRLTISATRRLPVFLAGMVLPTAVAAMEMVTLIVSPHGAAGSLAYSQMGMPALAQGGAIGGVPAVVFLILLPGSMAGLILAYRPARAEALRAGLAAGLVLFAAALFSAARLGAAPLGPSVPIGIVASNRFEGIPHRWDLVWALYGPAIPGAATPGGVVVIPEKIALLDADQAARAAAQVSHASVTSGATIIVGIEVKNGPVYRNRALVAWPDGRTGWYDKQRLVPGREDRDQPGKTPLRWPLAGGEVGVAICKDMHIPSIGAAYAGAGLVVVPAWDFGNDGDMGAHMTAFRGIENGYAVARSARNGKVGVYDPQGRVLAERDVRDGITTLHSQIALAPVMTPYRVIGDLFGWLCFMVTIGLLLWPLGRCISTMRPPMARQQLPSPP